MLSGLLNHRCCLARLLAFRHSGVPQYLWRSRFRQSGTNNFLQCRHLQRRVSGFIWLEPPALKLRRDHGKPEEHPLRKKTQKEEKKIFFVRRGKKTEQEEYYNFK